MRGVRFLLVLLLCSVTSAAVLATPSVFHPASEIKGGILGSDFGAQDFGVNGSLTIYSGKLAVNTSSASAALEVNGGIKITGSSPTITGFASAPTLGGGSASNSSVPTQWAVKQYVDSQVASGASGWTKSGTTVSLTTSTDNVSANTLYVDNTNGRVGIGTSTPSYDLQVVGPTGLYVHGTGTGAVSQIARGTAATNSIRPVLDAILNSSGTAADGFGPNIEFAISGTGVSNSVLGAIGFMRDGSNTQGKFYITTDSQNNANVQLAVDHLGNVGIGTSNPGAKLDVNGNARLNGSTRSLQIGTTGCQDIYLANTNNKIEYCANQFSFTTTQSQGFTFNGGNVGIGEASSGAKLAVNGSLALQNGVSVTGFVTNSTLGGASASNSSVPTQWAVKQYVDNQIATGAGDVTGPGSSTNNAIAKFSGTTGKTIANSGVTIDSSNNLATSGTGTFKQLIVNDGGANYSQIEFLNPTNNWKIQTNPDGSIDFRDVSSNLPILSVQKSAPEYSIRVLSNGNVYLAPYSSTGEVGIGTPSPSARLDVNGSLHLQSGATVTSFSTATDLGGASTSNSTVPTQAAVKAYVDSQFVSGASGWIDGGSTVHLATSTDNVNATTLYVDNSNGRVGINTGSPSYALDVIGQARINSTLYLGQDSQTAGKLVFFDNGSIADQPYITTDQQGRFYITSWSTNGDLNLRGSALGTSAIKFQDSNGNTFGSVYTAGTNAGDFNFDSNTLYVKSSSNRVGIGTGAPNAKLDVNGNLSLQSGVAVTGFVADSTLGGGSASNSSVPTEWAVKRYVDTAVGNAGNVSSVGLSLPSEFSVSGSPVTSSGTLTATWASESANTVLAGPTSGSGTPSFRTLVANDIPSLDASKITTGEFNYARVRAMVSKDTRSTNLAPENYSAAVQADFKQNSADGLSDGGTYHGVITFRPYGVSTDFSGGPAHQLAFTQNGNLWQRSSTSATTWGSWTQIQNGIGSTTCTYGIESIGTDGTVTCAARQGTGNVTGPASSTNNAIAKFSGTTGKVIANSGVTIDSSNNLATSGSVSAGSVSSTGAVTAGSVKTSGVLNQTGTGVVQEFANGCTMTSNSTGLYWTC